ncbi:hypothetical protein XCR_2487 [Xanthomonas campestris pv. raphani 756C]|nr:hypothetical protein XCR_2487 [Xanthomonas campestris pv. raphani 756C]
MRKTAFPDTSNRMRGPGPYASPLQCAPCPALPMPSCDGSPLRR